MANKSTTDLPHFAVELMTKCRQLMLLLHLLKPIIICDVLNKPSANSACRAIGRRLVVALHSSSVGGYVRGMADAQSGPSSNLC